MKAFVYLRVSGKGQVDGDGFERQLLACEKYAAENSIEITEIFREEGVSGTKELDDRPALSNLLAALEENGVKTILIAQVDRLARDLMVQETIIGDLQKSGYTLISVAEPDLCSQDPSRVLIRQIFGALAQYDRAMIVLKLRGARQRKRLRTGKGEGRDAFGTKSGESETLEKMQYMRSKGFTCENIARMLNGESTLTRYGKKWRANTIAKILKRDGNKLDAAA
jgi:DNA invertase Pin-like site-specific DNA recombinase